MISRSAKVLLISVILLASSRASAYDYVVQGYIQYVEHYNDGSFTLSLASTPGGPTLTTLCTNGSWPGHVGVGVGLPAGTTADGVKAYLASVTLALAASRQVTVYANLTAGAGSSCSLAALDSW